MGAASPSGRVLSRVGLLLLGVGIAAGSFRVGTAEGRRLVRERRRTPVVDAVRHAAPAVVSVTARTGTRRGWTDGMGAGVIVHPSGLVATNSHVIDGAQQVFVELWQGNGRYEADIVVNRPQDDLAILRLRANRRFPYVSCGTGERVMLGETAIAIGNPKGLGDTITVGVVSALGREARMTTGVALTGLIQTDASINTGNSGGALLNLDGELMGIIVSLMPESTGIAFAIPSDRVCPLVVKLAGRSPEANALPPQAAEVGEGRIETIESEFGARAPSPGSAGRADASGGQLPPPRYGGADQGSSSGILEGSGSASRGVGLGLTAARLGMQLEVRAAALAVRQVTRDAPAWRAGLLPGDMLLSLDGRPVESVADVDAVLADAPAGSRIELGVRRGQTLHVAYLELPAR